MIRVYTSGPRTRRLLTAILTCGTLHAPLTTLAQTPALPLESASGAEIPRDLHVLSPTLAPEQIDRAVLNRLMQEILDNPGQVAAQLQVNITQVQDILTTLSNAHGFINDNDMANVQAMCAAWHASTLAGTARVEEALAAYARREQFTLDFIARYYRMVLASIEASLADSSRNLFQRYMEDRRRRMASAGAVTGRAVSENVRSGEESVRFHCRDR